MSQGNEIKSKAESPNVLESGPQIAEIGFPDDGLYTGPATKTATLAEDGSIMSDDENRTLTTLEAPPKPPTEVPNAGSSDAARKLLKQAPERKLPSEKSSVRKEGVMYHTSKKQMIVSKPAVRLPSKEDLIQKIRGRLSKSIEPKPEAIPPAKPKTLDSSGAIEIPTDMILSSDIPATALPSAEAEEIELEDHDLIAILEGNDVEIRCVAKASGRIEEDEDETMVEEMQITIMDGEEVHRAQLARDKEIARRQIESLPTLQKGRPRSRAKLEDAPELLQQANTTTNNNSLVVHSKPASAGVTIGQTTIRAIPKKTPVTPLDTPLATDSGQIMVKQESKPKHIEKLIQPTRKPSEVKKPPKVAVPKAAAVHSELSVTKLMKSPNRYPVVVVKKSPLIDSLVSDWDEEQVVMVPELKTEKDTVAKASQSTALSATPEDDEQGTQFVAPSSTIEPVKRVKKKKIIWDPSDSSIPFAALVKAGRTQQPPGESTSNERTVPSAVTMRRKRADSVAVHMIEERSRCVDRVPLERKRALTPDPAKTGPEEGFPKHTPKPEPSMPVAIDPKAKKRKNEIERLLGDEGAINMLYDVECETTRKDLLKDGEVDTSDEDEKLLAKTKIITDVVIKQSKLPTKHAATSQALRVRTKRSLTPSQSPGGGASEIRLPESPKAVAAEIKVANNNNNPTTAKATATRKRKNASIGKGWDYVYNAQGGEDAMIIRRRSNSSYSSSASSRRLSIDLSACEKAATPVAPSERQEEPPAAATAREKFLFAKPTKKASSPPEVKVDVKLLSSMKDVMSKALKIGAMKQDAPKVKARSTSNRSKAAPKGDATVNGADQTLQKHLEQLTELVCTKYDSFVELGLKTQGVRVDPNSVAEHEMSEPLQDVFSFVVMNELRETLTLLESDESVHAVLLRSEGTNFSRGLDVGYLIQPPETLEETAQTMSECLKNFLKVLLNFSKPIVAAIHGEVIGMGVMLLPTFDLVIAQSGTMLSAPYGHLGYLPEALKAFSSCHTVRNKAITELLLLGKRITCYTGLEYGLVTDVVIPERLHTRARSLTKTLATRSAQAIQSTKQHLRYELLMNLDTILTLEQKQHAKQWTTAECQTMFKKFVEKGGVL